MRQESSGQWHFWSSSSAETLERLNSGSKGLSGDEARRRHLCDAHLRLKPKSRLSTYELLARQSTSPMILILLAAAWLAFFLADPTDTAIILLIVLAGGLLGFWQERNANRAVASLLAIMQAKADAWRDKSQVAARAAGVRAVAAAVPGGLALHRRRVCPCR